MLLDISPELLNNITRFLDYKDKLVLASTCKEMAKSVAFGNKDDLCLLFHKIITTLGNNYTFYTSPMTVGGMRLWHTINVYVDMIVVFQYIFTRKGNAIFSRCLHCSRYNILPNEVEKIINMFQSEKPISNHGTISDNDLIKKLKTLIND